MGILYRVRSFCIGLGFGDFTLGNLGKGIWGRGFNELRGIGELRE